MTLTSFLEQKHLSMTHEPRAADHASLYRRSLELTMPAGALDSLIQPTLKILAQRRSSDLSPLRAGVLLFAGDHAVAREHGVSAYPPEVTPQMVVNIVNGGAAISQLAARRAAPMMVCDVGLASGCEELLSEKIRPRDDLGQQIFFRSNNLNKAFPHQGYEHGARDITRLAALSPDAHAHCWNEGVRCVDDLLDLHACDVIALGEMGIGNTTPAAALAALLTHCPLSESVGRGTGANDDVFARKKEVVKAAVERATFEMNDHAVQTWKAEGSPLWSHALLAQLGGAEFSALAGAAWRAAQRGVIVLLDGIIVTAAVAPFAHHNRIFAQWLMASHLSAEPAHSVLLSDLLLKPLLNLQMRLGEGSGAAFALGLLQDADALLRNMATFSSAGVSSGEN
jgi:nicotinate-nucleotide--dimethylbenzimidazole phosphoribosyltransferase